MDVRGMRWWRRRRTGGLKGRKLFSRNRFVCVAQIVINWDELKLQGSLMLLVEHYSLGMCLWRCLENKWNIANNRVGLSTHLLFDGRDHSPWCSPRADNVLICDWEQISLLYGELLRLLSDGFHVVDHLVKPGVASKLIRSQKLLTRQSIYSVSFSTKNNLQWIAGDKSFKRR